MPNRPIKLAASITLLLREQDVKLLLQALRRYQPADAEEAHIKKYLLDVLEYLVLPE